MIMRIWLLRVDLSAPFERLQPYLLATVSGSRKIAGRGRNIA
jgi:hypothetical protein